MNRKKGKELHSGRPYSNLEYMLIFFAYIRGYNMGQVARSLERSFGAIHSCWRRMCHNASADHNKKIYDFLKPFSDKPWSHINGYAEEYIEAQIFEVEEKSNAQTISKQTGIPTIMIQKYITHLKQIPRKEIPSLFEDD